MTTQWTPIRPRLGRGPHLVAGTLAALLCRCSGGHSGPPVQEADLSGSYEFHYDDDSRTSSLAVTLQAPDRGAVRLPAGGQLSVEGDALALADVESGELAGPLYRKSLAGQDPTLSLDVTWTRADGSACVTSLVMVQPVAVKEDYVVLPGLVRGFAFKTVLVGGPPASGETVEVRIEHERSAFDWEAGLAATVDSEGRAVFSGGQTDSLPDGALRLVAIRTGRGEAAPCHPPRGGTVSASFRSKPQGI
jgi:hypothetical protein